MSNCESDEPKITDIACIPTLDLYVALLASVHHQYLPAKGPDGFIHLQMARKVAQAVKRIVRHQHWRYELGEFMHIEAYLSDLLVLDETALMARYAGYACSSSLSHDAGKSARQRQSCLMSLLPLILVIQVKSLRSNVKKLLPLSMYPLTTMVGWRVTFEPDKTTRPMSLPELYCATFKKQIQRLG